MEVRYAQTYRWDDDRGRYTLAFQGEVYCWLNGHPFYIPHQEMPPRLYDCYVDIVQVLEAVIKEFGGVP